MRPVGSKYLLEEVLGRGATGTVWRGQVRDSGDRVAIKVLKEELATDPDVVMRFLRERSVLLRLSHPNIVRVRDLVVEGELLALVMDLVDSPDLHRYLREHGRFSPAGAAMVTAQIADALAASHADGVVHRDLKPANILLEERRDPQGRVLMRPMLTDFGIARLADSPGLTRTSEFVGTPAYVAPESAEGREQTSAVDIYGAGIVLYELATGRPPFQGESALAVLRQHLDSEPERPSGLPEPLWTVIEHCLDKEPTRRPSAETLSRALRTVAEGIGVHAAPAQIAAAEGVAALLAPDPAPAPALAPGEHPAADPTAAGAGGPDATLPGTPDPSQAQTSVLPTSGAPGAGQPGGPGDPTAVLPQTGRGAPGQGGEADRTAVLPAGPPPPQQPPHMPTGWENQLQAARDRSEQTEVAPYRAEELPPGPPQRPQRAPMPYTGREQPAPQQQHPQQPQPQQQYYPQQQQHRGRPPEPAPQRREPRPRPEPRQRRPRQPMRIPGLGCLKGCLFIVVIIVVLAILVWNFTPLPDWVAEGKSWWQALTSAYQSVSDWISSIGEAKKSVPGGN